MKDCIGEYRIEGNRVVKLTENLNIDTTNDVVVYEVIRIINRKILFYDEHFARFNQSLKTIQITVESKDILYRIKQLIDANNIETGNIKFQIAYNRVTKTNRFVAFFIPHSYPDQLMYQNGVDVISHIAFRPTPSAKIIHADLKAEMDQLLSEHQVFEIIMIHPEGYITEGSRTNFFMIKNNIIYSAPLADILSGITYQNVLRICNEHRISFIESRISKSDVFMMDALFLSGTSPKILPINKFDDKIFDVNHVLVRKIMREYDNLLMNNLT